MADKIMKRGVWLLILLSLIFPEIVDGKKNNRKETVSGFVTDVNNKPVAGAMILTDRRKTNVLTNKKGFYRIRISPGTIMIGAWSQENGSAEAEIDGGTEVNIVLYGQFAIQDFEPAESEGDEMINIGYGKVSRKNLTTSPGHINGDADRYSSYSSIYEMISGEVPGVQVAGNQILIRGVSSINSSNDPLFVVDGIVVSTIDGISPRDVKSITILKGSDAAIYGTRAAGGVILIDLRGVGDR
jgi:TonB-dependent SusC/RagA subfamily outer membrane receptor